MNVVKFKQQTLDDTVNAMVDHQRAARAQAAEKQAQWRAYKKEHLRGSHPCPGTFASLCGRPVSNNVMCCWSCAMRIKNRVEPAERWMENAA